MPALSVTAANVLKGSGSQTQTVTAGVAITAGQYCYLDTSNLAQLADADGSSVTQVVDGVAANNAGAGQPVTLIQANSSVAITPGFTASAIGVVIYLFDTAGGATETFADLESGDKVIVLGVMVTTTTMKFYPVTGGTL